MNNEEKKFHPACWLALVVTTINNMGRAMADEAAKAATIETNIEAHYRVALMQYVELSPDFQYINNPGMNSERDPVKFVGFRLHLDC